MSTIIDTSSSNNFKALCAAHSLNSTQRQGIAIKAVSGNAPISHVANTHGTGRKFVYKQKEKALNGISKAFENHPDGDKKVLFFLPITKAWIWQFILALVLIARAPYQGVIEILRNLFDYAISKGSIHTVVYTALEKSKEINRGQNLISGRRLYS